jgi:hypothetical protein
MLQETLETIPENPHAGHFFIFSKGTDSLVPISDCSICFETLQDADKRIIKLACEHFFHLECLSQWVRTSAPTSHQCPICRTDIDQEVILRMSTVFERFYRTHQRKIRCAAYCGVILAVGGILYTEFYFVMSGASALANDAENKQHAFLEHCKTIEDKIKREICHHTIDDTAAYEMNLARFVQPVYLIALVWKNCARRRNLNRRLTVSAALPPQGLLIRKI